MAIKPDLKGLTPGQITNLAYDCMSKLNPADRMTVVLEVYQGRDLDDLVDELEDEISIRDDPDANSEAGLPDFDGR